MASRLCNGSGRGQSVAASLAGRWRQLGEYRRGRRALEVSPRPRSAIDRSNGDAWGGKQRPPRRGCQVGQLGSDARSGDNGLAKSEHYVRHSALPLVRGRSLVRRPCPLPRPENGAHAAARRANSSVWICRATVSLHVDVHALYRMQSRSPDAPRRTSDHI
jgi:hypothetical protein